MRYEEMTSKELKAIAKEKKVKDWWNKSKAILIADLKALEEPEVEIEEPETITEAPISAIKEPNEKTEQNAKPKNKKPNLKLTELTYKGETKSIRAWAEELNMPWPTLYDRVNRNGWSVEDAIEIPLGQRRPR